MNFIDTECVEKKLDAEHPFGHEVTTDGRLVKGHFSPRKPTQAEGEKLQKQTSKQLRRTLTHKSSRSNQVHAWAESA